MIAFQEAIIDGCNDPLDLRRLLAYYGWGHYMAVLTGGGRTSNGGVFIASKWPIQTTAQHIFSACERILEDCLAANGVQYVKIRKSVGGETRDYHVFATHLQAQSGAAERQARLDQAAEFARFVQDREIPADEAVVSRGTSTSTGVPPAAPTSPRSWRLSAPTFCRSRTRSRRCPVRRAIRTARAPFGSTT